MDNSNISILVIEDDPDLRHWCVECLKKSAFHVFQAGNGADALLILRTIQIQIVLTDIVMPQKGGLETITAVKNEFPDIRIIAMSGAPRRHESFTLAKQLGVDGILYKPFTKMELFGKIEKVMGEQVPMKVLLKTFL